MNKKYLVVILCLILSIQSFSKTSHFNKIFTHLISVEGEKAVKLEDGWSKFGLTTYYVKNPKDLTKEQAYDIIYEEVYLKYKLNEIKRLSVKHLILDYIYNSNPYKAIKKIKKLAKRYDNRINEKSIKIDEYTLKVLNTNKYIFNDIYITRLNYIRSLKLYKKYGKGWERRLNYFKEEYEYEFDF